MDRIPPHKLLPSPQMVKSFVNSSNKLDLVPPCPQDPKLSVKQEVREVLLSKDKERARDLLLSIRLELSRNVVPFR